MKRKQAPKDQPERRRALAEINLLGQKGAKPQGSGRKRSGCAQIFGVLTVLGGAVLLLGLAIAAR